MEDEQKNGVATYYSDEPEAAETLLSIELTLAEAESLKAWALRPGADGGAAIDDPDAKPALVKLGRAIDFMRAVASVRDALDGAGLSTYGLSDEEVADIGRQISNATALRGH